MEAKAVAGVKIREKSESVAINMAFEFSDRYQKHEKDSCGNLTCTPPR